MALARTPWIGRRGVIGGLTAAAGAWMMPSASGLAQNRLSRTPPQTEGPFYPADWSGDADNDLVVVRGEAARANGQIAHVSGRVLGSSGEPIAGALVEIWQCDANGIYRHPRDGNGTRRDRGFQGRGRISTDAAGLYSFRTIRPVAYPGRTPHIHFKVVTKDRRTLVTQMYVLGESRNDRDGVLNGIRDARQRESVIVRLDPADRLELGALAGTFDIVLG